MIASTSHLRPFLRPLCAAVLLCGASGAVADSVTLVELPAPDGYPVAGATNITADGTVIGVAYPEGLVVRWQPGAEPEVLGGGMTFTLDNITPVVSKDGAVIATTGYFDEGGDAPVAAPEIWTGGTDWARITGASAELGSASVFGISADGNVLTGSAEPAVPPAEGPWPQLPWMWTAADGQVRLALPADAFSAQAWAASNDGHVVAGFGRTSSGDFTRYALRWDDGVPSWITDANGQRVGQVIGCNSDCSVIVGAGVENGQGDPRAWRWRAGVGLEYLDLPEGAQAGAVTYAFESSEDGNVIVGSYVVFDPNLGPTNHGFYWTAADGPQDITGFLAGWGIDFGAADWIDLLVVGVTPDGRTLLLNGLDADYQRRRAVVQVQQDDWIFADSFEGFGPLRAD
ncbi:hypothetical protein [Dokdonella fugitiva]|jgi:uncharacterized membrane protein|uniref:HAF family extracellular repeat protein n=1 Tax=Dokdonella fugitiva TaxID=328517 RepID=A0A4R2IFF5_9GAMM|nr:hypothetical protein [Dokdonella fugitiva]MBA8883673.1 putative membrane protein [Dokdonella fugitiva]TCO41415.1 hypothetical protein EV148_103335 [Dokdonella fugitiva]